MIFYILSAVLALFCAIALGLGPLVFALGGALLAVIGFRARRPRWWGLPLAVGGATEAIGALAGWRSMTVLILSLVLFAVFLAVRLAGHRATGDRPPGDRGPNGSGQLSGWRPPGGVRR